MRLEVKTLGKGLGFSRENIAVYDADYGNLIEGIENIDLNFDSKEQGQLKITVTNLEGLKVFEFDEKSYRNSGIGIGVKHIKSGRYLSGVTGFKYAERNEKLIITICDFDVDIKIIRPHKEYNRSHEGTRIYL